MVAGTVTLPIFARFADKEYHLGDLTLDCAIADGKFVAPTTDEIVEALKEVREC